jgi:hypothetical protein
MLLHVRKSDGELKAVEGEDSGEIRVVLCGTQLDGTITPLLCDADGKLVTTA